MRKLALVTVLAAALVLGGQPAQAQFSLGGIRNSLVQWVLDKISVEDVFEITVGEVVGGDEGTTLRDVSIADAEGVWFTTERLSFDFNRSRLLRGQLFIDNLELENVEVFRQPVIPAGEAIEVNVEGVDVPPEAPFYWPRSPVTAAIERMALQNVRLHEPVLGQDVTFDATGSFRDQGDVQQAALELRRTDEVAGTIDFEYARGFSENTLALNLDAAEAPRGLVSALAGLPPEVPVRVTLAAEGTPDEFRTTFDLGLTDYLQAQGTATVDYAGPLGIDAQFTATPGPLMPEEYAQILGSEAELVVQASEGPDQTVQIQTARITSPYLRATVDGTYSRATGAVDAEVELVADPQLADPFEGVAFAGMEFRGRIKGEPGSLAADGDLLLQGFATEQIAVQSATLDIDVAQSGSAEAPVTEVTAEGLVQGLRLDQVGPDVIGPARIELAATLAGEELVLETALIDSEPLNVSASGTANISTFDFAVDYGLAAPALGPILEAYGIEGAGSIDARGNANSDAGVLTLTTTAELNDFVSEFASAERLQLDGTVVQSADRTTFNLAGTGEELGIGEIGPDLLPRADLALSGVLEGETLVLDTARVTSPVLDAVVEGQVGTAGDRGQLSFEVASGDLAPVADAYGLDLGGAFEASGTAVLRPEGTTLEAQAALTDLTGDVEAERLALTATVDQTGERTGFSVAAVSPGLTVQLAGEELSGPVDLVVTGAVEGEELVLEEARVDSPILDARVEGQLNLSDFSGAIAYDVDEARLPALAPLLGVELTGVMAAEGEAVLPATEQGPLALEGTAAVENLGVMGTFIGDLAATYDLTMADAPAGSLRLSLTDSPYAPEGPTVLTLDMGGPAEAWELEFALSAPNYLQAGGSAVVNYQGPLSVSADFSARPGPALPEQYAQLLGEEAELVVEAAEGEDGTIVIDTARISSPMLNAQVSGTYSPETGAADLEVALEAEPGLAAPFEGVEFKGLTFRGDVSGEPGTLAADGNLVLEGFSSDQLALGRAVLDIDVSQTGTAENPTTQIAAQGVVDGLRVAAIGPDVIGEARIALDAALTGDELVIEEARIDSQPLQLWAQGTADISTAGFDLDYRLATPAVGPLAEAFGVEAAGAVTATGRVASEGDALTVETRAEATELRSPYADAARLQLQGTATRDGDGFSFDGRVEAVELTSQYADAQQLQLQGTVSQDGDRTAFDVTGAGAGLRLEQLGGDPLGDADFAARGVLDGSELRLDEARVDSPVLRATAEGTVDLDTGAGRLTYDVAEVALGAVGPALDLPVTGTLSGEGVLGLGETTGGSAPRAVGEARFQNLSYGGTAIGTGVLAHDVLLSESPSGTLDLSLTGGPYAPAGIETAFRLQGQQLVLDGLEAEGFGVELAGDVTVDLETLAADGPLRLRVAEGSFAPAEATAQARLRGDRLVLDGLRVRALGLTAAGDVTVNIDTLLAEGTLRIDDADLSELGALVGAPVTGDAEGTLRLSAEGGRQVVALDLSAAGLDAYGVQIGTARIDGRVVDVRGTPQLDLTVVADRLVSGEITLAAANISARGPLSALDIVLRGTGETGRKPLTVYAAATADLAGAATRVVLAETEIALGEDRIALLAPLTVVSRGGVVEVEDMAIALPDGGRLTGDLSYFGGPVAGNIALDAPDISFLSRLVEVPVEAGSLRVAGTFDTRRGSAGADLSATGRDIVVADISGAGVLDLDAAVLWDGEVAAIDATVAGDFDRPLVIEARLPVRATAGLPALAESGPVSARVNWEGEIGDLWALVPAPGHVLTGDARIDIGVSGDISSPIFTGGILLADGIYQNLDYGTILTGLSLATEIESTGGLGLRLEGVDGAQGNVSVEGRIGFGEQWIDLTVETRQAVLIRRDDAIVRADADMRIYQEPDGRLVIDGTILVPEAEVRLVNTNPPEIVTLGEVRIKGEPIVDESGGASLPIRLNIDVNAPGRVFVRGRGLDSEWAVDLDVRGTADEPRVTGEIVAVRGGLDLLGREFELERGRVLFNGGRVIDPRLDVSLVRETSDITGRILVTGTISDPELSFSSTPALPEDEVLPRLLFGTSAQALTPAQGLQLALGLATLLDGGGGTLDGFRAALGLDALGITQDDDGAALEVGKQVTDRVWVGTRQSFEGGGTTVAVEVDIFRNFEAYGEVSTEGDSTVGVQWRKDF